MTNELGKFFQTITALSTYDAEGQYSDIVVSRINAIDSGAIQLDVGLPSAINAIIAHADVSNVVNVPLVTRTLKHCRTLVRKCPGGDPMRFKSLIYMAIVARVLFSENQEIRDLNEAITALRNLLQCATDSVSDRAEALEWLARTLFDRFLRERNVQDLNEVCEHLNQALTLELPTNKRATVLTNLGVALSAQFEMFGRMPDLQTAIQHHTDALSIQPVHNRSMVLYSLANDLLKRFDQLEERDDLERAVQLHHEALLLRNNPGSHRRLSQVSLGRALATRFQSSSNILDMDAAITHHRDALESCHIPGVHASELVGDEEHALCISAYISSAQTCMTAAGTTSDDEVQKAIDRGKDAVRLLPENHPLLTTIWATIGRLYLLFQPLNCSNAMHYFRRASNLETASTRERLSIAIEWASYARYKSNDMVATKDAYDTAMGLLNRCIIAYATVDAQHEFLTRPLTKSTCSSLAADAASFAISQDRLEDAVEILEQGRTFVWSRLRGYRPDLSELRNADPRRADNFQRLSTEVERFSVTFESSGSMVLSDVVSVGFIRSSKPFPPTRRNLAEEWRRELDSIREDVPGFRYFLEPLPFSDLHAAAAEGPVILLNHSKDRSDALILQSLAFGAEAVTVVPLSLPGDTLQRLIQQQLDILSTYGVRGGDKVDQPELLYRATRLSRLQGFDMIGTLRETWTAIVSPVIAKLRLSGSRRIWWCPTGIIGALPLHAAGPYGTSMEQQNAYDICVPSYTPTLSTLITAREAISPLSNTPNLLFVGLPTTLGKSRLPGVLVELDAVRRHTSAGIDLVQTSAECGAVLEHLPNHPWIHFACHGMQHPMNPFHSAFSLFSQDLSLRDFMTAHHPHAGLAFLSACQSAAPSNSLPDEALHMSAAVQLCGFRSVIGTLWSIGDNDAPTVADEVYRFLLRNGPDRVDVTETALALHHGLQRLRDTVGKYALTKWVPYVHIGI